MSFSCLCPQERTDGDVVAPVVEPSVSTAGALCEIGNSALCDKPSARQAEPQPISPPPDESRELDPTHVEISVADGAADVVAAEGSATGGAATGASSSGGPVPSANPVPAGQDPPQAAQENQPTAQTPTEGPPSKPPAAKEEEPAAEEEKPAKGCVRRCLRSYEQQAEPKILLPMKFFRKTSQGFCAAAIAGVSGLFGVICLTASPVETVVDYAFSDSTVQFDIDEAMEGPVAMSYELEDVYVNQKRFIQNKDGEFFNNLMSKYVCEDADTWEDVDWRRGATGPWQAARAERPDIPFRPCGLIALSMFSDRYELFRLRDGTTSPIELDETDIALPADSLGTGIYKDLEEDGQTAGGQTMYAIRDSSTDELVSTWLQGETLLQHFWVWHRIPASPRIRNLWASIPDGLDAGRYELRIPENSPVWEERWGLGGKRIIFAKLSAFGSVGACTFFGTACLVFAGFEVIMVLLFCVVPSDQSS